MVLNGRNKSTLKYLKGADYKQLKGRKGNNKPVTLAKALKRIYTPKSYNKGKTCVISVPCCLKGKQIKFILLENNNKLEE